LFFEDSIVTFDLKHQPEKHIAIKNIPISSSFQDALYLNRLIATKMLSPYEGTFISYRYFLNAGSKMRRRLNLHVLVKLCRCYESIMPY